MLTARRIAQSLGASTQPVYRAFGSMQRLRGDVLSKARAYAVAYLLQDRHDKGQSLSMGMRYFRFARTEKVLFKLLFLEGELAMTLETMPELSGPLVERMKQDPSVQGLSEDRVKRIGRDMWIYTHGLVSLMYETGRADAEETVQAHLQQMGRTVIAWERRQAHLPSYDWDTPE